MDPEALVEAVNGGVGSLTSKLSLYPLDLLTTRMSVGGTGDKAKGPLEVAADIVREQGVAGLYRGAAPKVFKSVTGKVLYFYLYRVLSDLANRLEGGAKGAALSMRANLVVGFLSEVLELPVIMPLEAVATRQQVAKPGTTVSQTLAELVREGKLYVALDAYVLGALQPAIQMTLFEQLKSRLLGTARKSLTVSESFLLGVVASSCAITATYPLEIARVRNQTSKASTTTADGKPAPAPGVLQVWADIMRTDGVPGLFRGLTPKLTQGVLSAALMLMVRERIARVTRRLLLGKKA